MVTIQITKKHLFFLSTILLLGFAVAYGGNTPTIMGHTAGELHVNIPGIGQKTLQDAINDNDIGGGEIEVGPANMRGTMNGWASHSQTYTATGGNFTTSRAVERINITISSGDGDHCPYGLNIPLDTSNGFKSGCMGTPSPGLMTYQTNRPCNAGENWHQFEAVPYKNTGTPDEDGVESIIWTFCDGSSNSGSENIAIHYNSYVLRIDGKRISEIE